MSEKACIAPENLDEMALCSFLGERSGELSVPETMKVCLTVSVLTSIFGLSNHAMVAGVKRTSTQIHAAGLNWGGRSFAIKAQHQTHFLADRSHDIDLPVRDVERRIGYTLTKKPKKRDAKTPITSEQCQRNPMQAIEEVEVKKRNLSLIIHLKESGTAVM